MKKRLVVLLTVILFLGLTPKPVSGMDFIEWEEVIVENGRPFIWVIKVDPIDNSIIYVGTESGLYKSIDAGLTWTLLINRGTKVLAIDPFDNQTMYLGDFYGHLYKTTDGGENYLKLPFINDQVSDLVVDPSNPMNVFVTTTFDGLFKTTDAGETWDCVWNQIGIYFLLPHPTQEDIFFAGTSLGLFKTDDSGKTWRQVVLPVNNDMVLGLTINPNNPDIMFAATYSVGVVKSVDGGESFFWNGSQLLNKPALAVSFDPSTCKVYVVVRHQGVYVSTDYGKNWQKCDKGLPSYEISIILPNPSRRGSMFAAIYRGALYTSVLPEMDFELNYSLIIK